MKEIYDFIKKCKTYFIATTDGSTPKVRPFGTINLFEGKLYIQTGKIKAVSKQIHTNPCVELCCFDGIKWLRLQGVLVEDERIIAKSNMLDAYPELKSMYSAIDGNMEVFYFESGIATFYSFTEEPLVIKFNN